MSKLVFFPWTSICAVEHGKMKSWIASGDFKIAHYTGNTVKAVSSKVVGGQIYIFGHSSPGSDTITNDDQKTITYQVAADRIVESGLSKMYSGAIKIYACNSGTPTATGFSFAKKFAKYMYFEKKYIFLRVYGYSAPVTSQMDDYGGKMEEGVYSKRSDHKKTHKFAILKFDDTNSVEVKAKEERHYFSPFGG